MTFWKLADSQGMETGSLGDVRCLDSFSPVLPSFTEKAMAPHPSALAWRIPGTGEPGTHTQYHHSMTLTIHQTDLSFSSVKQ